MTHQPKWNVIIRLSKSDCDPKRFVYRRMLAHGDAMTGGRPVYSDEPHIHLKGLKPGDGARELPVEIVRDDDEAMEVGVRLTDHDRNAFVDSAHGMWLKAAGMYAGEKLVWAETVTRIGEAAA